MTNLLWRSIAATLLILAALLSSSHAVAGDCRYIGQTCIETAETRNINGVPVYKECWKYQAKYECIKPDSVNWCAPLMSNSQCYQTSSQCIKTMFDGTCGAERRTYRCDDPNTPAPANTVVLDKTYTMVDKLDTAQCDPLSSDGNCHLASHTCVEPAETRVINGLPVYKDCWKWDDQYACVAHTPSNDCDALRNNPACTFKSESCVDSDPQLGCTLKDVHYSCITEQGSSHTVQDCSTKTACVGDTCWDTSSPPDGDFANAVIGNEIAREAGNYKSKDFQLFWGVQEECREGWGGLKKCCKDSPGAKTNNDVLMQVGFSAVKAVGKYAANVGSKYMYDYMYKVADWLGYGSQIATGAGAAAGAANFEMDFYGFGWSSGAAPSGASSLGNGFYFDPTSFAIAVAIYVITDLMSCEPDEQTLGMHKKAGLSVYVGAYCSKKVLGACTQESQVYCSYNSKLARILNVQGRKQLNKPWTKVPGDARTADCSGFTVEEFSKIDFSQVDMSEFVDDVMKAAQYPNGQDIATTVANKLAGKKTNDPNDATAKMPFGMKDQAPTPPPPGP